MNKRLTKYEDYLKFLNDMEILHKKQGFRKITNYQAKAIYAINKQNGNFDKYVEDIWINHKNESLDNIKSIYIENFENMLNYNIQNYHEQNEDYIYDLNDEYERKQYNENIDIIKDMKKRYKINKHRNN